MPAISRFFGIVIAMYFNDHNPPHFHAKYQEHEATVSIESLTVLDGSLPARAIGLVLEWAALHQADLTANWARARQGVPLEPVPPLE